MGNHGKRDLVSVFDYEAAARAVLPRIASHKNVTKVVWNSLVQLSFLANAISLVSGVREKGVRFQQTVHQTGRAGFSAGRIQAGAETRLTFDDLISVS